MKESRYHAWNNTLGQNILNHKMDLAELDKYTTEKALSPKPVSGKQELLEILMDV